MPKFVNFFYLFSLAVGILAQASAGDNTGPAVQYVVTLTKMELCTDAPLTSEEDVTCVGAVTLGNETMEFDIASVGLEQLLALTQMRMGFRWALPIGMRSLPF